MSLDWCLQSRTSSACVQCPQVCTGAGWVLIPETWDWRTQRCSLSDRVSLPPQSAQLSQCYQWLGWLTDYNIYYHWLSLPTLWTRVRWVTKISFIEVSDKWIVKLESRLSRLRSMRPVTTEKLISPVNWQKLASSYW